MIKTIKDDVELLSSLTWYDLDKKGCINKHLRYEPAVYIYMKTWTSSSKVSYYVGSIRETYKLS